MNRGVGDGTQNVAKHVACVVKQKDTVKAQIVCNSVIKVVTCVDNVTKIGFLHIGKFDLSLVQNMALFG